MGNNLALVCTGSGHRWLSIPLVLLATVLVACTSTGSGTSTPTPRVPAPTPTVAVQAKSAPLQAPTPTPARAAQTKASAPSSPSALAPTVAPRISEPTRAAAPTNPANRDAAQPRDAEPFTGNWRVYSARLYYDQGGGGSVSDSSVTSGALALAASGTWQYGSSTGKWSTSPITGDDWKRWGVDSYGPTKKATLSGWNGSTADGPIEESAGRVDFVWVIYRVGPPSVGAAGTVWLKFGR